MRIPIIFLLIFSFYRCSSQELFVYTEPASNMAAKSIGIRVANSFMKESGSEKYNYHFLPEIMLGVSKRIMVHGEGFFSNRENAFKAEGGSLYLKYRFYSQDEVHSHFRIAAFARGAYNDGDIHQPAIDLNGHNSGYEAGIVTTKLIHKLALSAIGSYLHAIDNGNNNKFGYNDQYRDAVGYSFSAGKLLIPVNYTDYRQTNLNVMLEFLGQTNLGNSRTYLDMAPSVQLIFLSRMRLDLGYRFAVVNDLLRNANNGFLLRFEYNFFNAYK